MSLIEKAQEQALDTGSHVFNSLVKIKFLLVTIPMICVIVALVSQQLIQERNVATTKFKIGTFATPANPDPVLLASETQLVARLRENAIVLREEYPKALLIAITIDGDVVTMTATDLSPEKTEAYILEVANLEIDFQNTRLEKLQAVQNSRKDTLGNQLEGFLERAVELESALQMSDKANLLPVQQELKNTRDRIAGIRLELHALALLNASDLFIDTTQIILTPVIVASSTWYRPLLFGGIGLAAGLAFTFIIAIVTIILSFSRKQATTRKG